MKIFYYIQKIVIEQINFLIILQLYNILLRWLIPKLLRYFLQQTNDHFNSNDKNIKIDNNESVKLLIDNRIIVSYKIFKNVYTSKQFRSIFKIINIYIYKKVIIW